MAQEGIATLPMQDMPAESQGIGAFNPEAQAAPKGMTAKQAVSSRDALDASKQALAQSLPGGLEEYERIMDELVAQIDLPPEQVDQLLQVLDMLLNNEARYPELRAELIASGQAEEDDLPPEFDRGYLTTILNVLLEKQARTGPQAMPAPQQFNQGGLAAAAESLRRQGRGQDTILAHINPQEAQMLKRMGGSGTINPKTGLPEFGFLSKAWKAVTKPIKSIASSTVGRIVLTVALGAVLGPAGVGLSSALAGGIAAAGTTLAAGGSLKDALISGAVGGISMGLAPSVGTVMPGAAGSFLNTALSAGAVGTGVGLLRGQKFGDALKSGVMAGVTAGGIGSLSNQMTPQEGAPVFDDGLRATTVDANGNVVPVDTSVPMPDTTSATNIAQQGGANTDFGLKAGPAPTPAASPMAPRIMGQDMDPVNYNMTGSVGGATSPTSLGSGSSRLSLGSGTSADPSLSGIGSKLMSGKIGGAFSELGDYAVKYPGRTAMLGLGAATLAGGFTPEPSTPPGIVDRRTGTDYINADPRKYVVQNIPGVKYTPEGNIDYSATAPKQKGPYNTVVQTPQFGGVNIPRNPFLVDPTNPFATQAIPGYRSGGISQAYPRRTGPISGPGTGTSDSIPAMLSDGEFVITAKAVKGVGNGSRREGAKKLYRMMHAMEKKAGGKV